MEDRSSERPKVWKSDVRRYGVKVERPKKGDSKRYRPTSASFVISTLGEICRISSNLVGRNKEQRIKTGRDGKWKMGDGKWELESPKVGVNERQTTDNAKRSPLCALLSNY